MGIKGLHGLLKSIQKPCNLKKFDGQTLGVDAYGWLHRGTVACAIDLALDKPTRKHIDFVLNRVRMLLFFGVTPYLVFDGDNLPSKSGTEADRLRKREESKKLALELHNKGRIVEAQQEFQKAVDVTPYMARHLIEELKVMKVQYVVAPYEADAQLVYLERQGIINGIISEDSDLLVFGARRLLSKLDQHGDCIEINRGEFAACRDISLIGWTDADFRRMCILSGCDYLPNIPKMGLKTAYRHMRKYKSVEKVLRILQFDGQCQVPAGYLEKFKQAENTFLYQRVFCPTAQKLVTLTSPDPGLELKEMPYIGGDIDPEIAIGVACGDLDPMTKDAINLKPSFAARAVPTLNRRQTWASSTELKAGKPINSFFTPRRVPLTELDPNNLTPSPSQQRLLERHANSSWQPSPAPARSGPMRSISSAPFNRVGSSPMVMSAERQSFLARAAKPSTVPTAKRQRLCSDVDEDTLPTPSKEACSRFFKVENLSRVKKSRKSTFGVFSDDLAEDIMCQIAESSDPTDSAKPVRTQDVTKIEPLDLVAAPADSTESVSPRDASNEAANPDNPDKRDGDNVTNESVNDVDAGSGPVNVDTVPELLYQISDARVEQQNASLLSKFAFSGSCKRPAHPLVSKEETTPQSQREIAPINLPETLSLGKSQSSSPSFRRRLTPLQRLGQSALSKSKSMDSNSVHKMLSSTIRDSGYESDFGVDGQSAATSGLNTFSGSEDQIVPCSDEEAEGSSDDGVKPTLNLQQFSFVPK